MKIKNFITTTLIVLFTYHANAQVLISLLLGDKLNSDNLKFGVDGGLSLLNMGNTAGAKNLPALNLGFYFDIQLKEKLSLYTGVLVKSKMGAKSLPVYSLNDPYLDSAFAGGTVTRKINYFNIPVLLRYRVKGYFFTEAGIQLGLRYTGYDIFKKDVYNKKDLQFKNEVKNNYTRFDAGGVLGIAYQLNKGEGITIAAKYYMGMVDVNKILSASQHNSAFYINLAIPVGRNKATKKEQEKEKT